MGNGKQNKSYIDVSDIISAIFFTLNKRKTNLEILTNSQKEIIQIAAKNGALTPEVIRELLRQQTAQKEIESKTPSVD